LSDSFKGYEYEVFVSYRSGFADRNESVPLATRTWTREVFAPQLRRWLASEVGLNRVFVDRDEIEAGARWPDEVADKLSRSKLLIAVLDATYRGSPWCMAELRTMVERERLLGLGPGGDQALVIPLRFGDGHRFPVEIKERTYEDFYDFARLEAAHSYSTVYLEMVERIRTICGRIRDRLENPPRWDPKWPALRPQASSRPPFAIPEL